MVLGSTKPVVEANDTTPRANPDRGAKVSRNNWKWHGLGNASWNKSIKEKSDKGTKV